MESPSQDPMNRESTKPASCLAVGELEEHLRGGGDADQRRKRDMHLKSCASCSTELDLLRSFLEGEPTAEERADVEWLTRRLSETGLSEESGAGAVAPSWLDRFRDMFRTSGWAWAGAAAMAVLAVAVFVETRPPDLPGGLGGGSSVVRSGQLEVVAPAGDLAAPPDSLQVKAWEGAVRYRFEVREVDRTLVWSSQTDRPQIDLPENVRAEAAPGRTLLWSAAALDDSGGALAETQAVRFRVQPEATP